MGDLWLVCVSGSSSMAGGVAILRHKCRALRSYARRQLLQQRQPRDLSRLYHLCDIRQRLQMTRLSSRLHMPFGFLDWCLQ